MGLFSSFLSDSQSKADKRDYDYLPLSHSHSHSASTSSASSVSIPPSSRAASPIHREVRDTAKRRRKIVVLFTVLQLAMFGLSVFAIVSIVELMLGRLQRTHRASVEELKQAGWVRRPLDFNTISSSSPDSSSSSNKAQITLHDFSKTPQSPDSQHLLILSPLRNAASSLPHFFSLLDSLSHPKVNTSLGFLVGDETDDTMDRVLDYVGDEGRGGRYREVTVLRKDFNLDLEDGWTRHTIFKQDQRRSIMARARTYLLASTLTPSIDWVLWLDSDVESYPPSLFSDLLLYGNATEADVITPNIFRRDGGSLIGYDQNNWAETATSLKWKQGLDEEKVVVEGGFFSPTHRLHLTSSYMASNYTPEPDFLPRTKVPGDVVIDRYDPTSEAYIGKRMKLDGVGGVATLVRATTHRLGAVFPSWPVDHELETEGFAQLAKKVGARIYGLPNYVVLHATEV